MNQLPMSMVHLHRLTLHLEAMAQTYQMAKNAVLLAILIARMDQVAAMILTQLCFHTVTKQS